MSRQTLSIASLASKIIKSTPIITASLLLNSSVAFALNDTSGNWAGRCIERLNSIQLVRGYPDGSFRPNATVTRAEFAVLMLNAFPNAPKIRTAPRFRDVSPNFWGANAIGLAAERGFFSGYPDGTFKPNQAIPRVQAIAVMANAAKLPIPENHDRVLDAYFTDAAQIPRYAERAIAAGTRGEIVANYPDIRKLEPSRNASRGEIAAMLCQVRGFGDLVPAQYVVSEVNLLRDLFAFGPEIQAFGTFSEGLTMARFANGKIGYIDARGQTVIPPQFDAARTFTEERAAVAIGSGETAEWGYIDLQGNFVVAPQFAEVADFSEGLAATSLDGQTFGFIDLAGQEAIAPQFDAVLPFSEDLAAVYRDGEWGYIDQTGTVVIPFQFTAAASFRDGLARVEEGGKFGFIDRAGMQAIAPQFSAARDFSRGLAAARDETSQQWGYIDKTGNWAIAPQYNAAQDFSEGLAGVAIGEKWGFIDRSGNLAIPFKFYSPRTIYDSTVGPDADPLAVLPFDNGLALARNGTSVGFIDRLGRWHVEPLLYNDAEPISEGLARVHVGGEWIPEYDYPNNTPFVRGVALQGGGWGYIRILPPSN
ncbi:MAG: WG repeat-containing protein [Cyanobacteriota bacterium]|nr:WG repeat-containing protein [Cyanobacteriota bacterium]